MGKYDGRRSQSAATVPVALSVAGSDSSAGAGIQADIKTFSARGVYGLTAVDLRRRGNSWKSFTDRAGQRKNC